MRLIKIHLIFGYINRSRVFGTWEVTILLHPGVRASFFASAVLAMGPLR